jgi:hypothetical protein
MTNRAVSRLVLVSTSDELGCLSIEMIEDADHTMACLLSTSANKRRNRARFVAVKPVIRWENFEGGGSLTVKERNGSWLALDYT